MTSASKDTSNPSNDRTWRAVPARRLTRLCAVALAACGVLAVPGRAFAQTDEWKVDAAPLYFWAATTKGNLAINGNRDIPVYMDFADAKSKLAGAFALHVEARHGRWGVLGDVNFVRLSSDVSYTTPIIGAPITGTLKLDQVIFDGKMMYQVKPGTKFMTGIGFARYRPDSPLFFSVSANSEPRLPARNGFASDAGVSADVRLTHRISYRLLQSRLIAAHLDFGWQHGVQLATGLVFDVGR